jgi:hypothetical protein
MTRDEIIRMAHCEMRLIEEIERLRVENEQLRKLKFAAEELLASQAFLTEIWKARSAQLEGFLAEEREACARVCDWWNVSHCAAAIRARGE